MNEQEAFYIIGNIPIPIDDDNYDICQYQEAKAIALDCIQRVANEKIYTEEYGYMMWDGGYEQGRLDVIEEFKNKLIELYHKRYMHDIYLDDIDSIVEELKGEEQC